MNGKKTYTFRIEPQDIDFRRRVSLLSMTNYILTAAGKNANENGFGLFDLQTNDNTWVLTRLVVDLNRLLTDKDTLCIETWVESVGSVFTTRSFHIRDAKGVTLGYATSTWAIINMVTRRPVSLDTLPVLKRFVVDQTTPLGEAQKIPDVNGNVANTFSVKYSNLDVNKHANSMYYIQWISDCFPLDYYLSHAVTRLELNLMKEISYGDEGEVWKEENAPNDFSLQIVTRDKGLSCKARLVFKKTTEFYTC